MKPPARVGKPEFQVKDSEFPLIAGNRESGITQIGGTDEPNLTPTVAFFGRGVEFGYRRRSHKGIAKDSAYEAPKTGITSPRITDFSVF